MLVLVHRLDEGRADADAPIQLTVLNFTEEAVEGTVHSEALLPQHDVIDAATGETIGHVDDLQSFGVHLEPYGGLFLILNEPAPDPQE